MAKCKRCGIKTVLSDTDIKKMVEDVRNMRGVRLAEDGIYKERLAVCAECDKFMYGSTCSLCGCVMQVRAMLKDGGCPKRKWL